MFFVVPQVLFSCSCYSTQYITGPHNMCLRQDSRNPLSPMPCFSLCGTKKQSTMVAVGDKFPTAPVVHHEGFGGNTPSAIKTVGDMLGDNKKVLFVTLPGAFTPT